MVNRGRVRAELVGGELDGDEIILSPNGSVGYPRQLCYITMVDNSPAWMVYENQYVFGFEWPVEDEVKIRFVYVGIYSLGKGSLMKSANGLCGWRLRLSRFLCWLGAHDWRNGPGAPCMTCGKVDDFFDNV